MKRTPLWSGIGWVILAGMFAFYVSYAQEPPKAPPFAQAEVDCDFTAAKLFDFPPEKGEYYIVPLRCRDGDTIDFALVVNLHKRGRIHGINAPEIKTPAGVKAKAQLEALTPIGKMIPAQFFGADKYGGVILDYRGPQMQCVSKVMVETKNAAYWNGQGEKPLPPENK